MKKLFSLMVLGMVLGACQKENSKALPVQIDNFKQGERIIYPVPLLRGSCKDGLKEVTVLNKTTGQKLRCPAHNGRFKAWTRLAFGTNEVVVSGGGSEDTLKLFYERPKTDYLYQAYYFVDKTGDRKYLSNLKDDPQEKDPDLWLKKLRTSLELLQSYTADCMARAGFDRKTFSFNLDKNGDIDVQVVTGRYTRAEINEWRRPNDDFEEGTLYEEFLHAVGKDKIGGGKRRITGLVNTQAIRDGRLSGNSALGGFALAQFGANGLYGWPSSLDDVVAAFTNTNKIETPNNDSVGRNVQWGHVATTLGAYQHEIGHSMGLPHIEGPGIMARAGDHINRAFTFYEAPSDRCPTGRYFRVEEEDRWNKPELTWLNVVPHMNEIQGEVNANGPIITLGEDRDTLTVEAENGILMYDISDPSFVLSYDNVVYCEKPYAKTLTLKISECLEKIGKDTVQINVIDANGNGAEATFMKMTPEAPERSYDFAEFELGKVDGQFGCQPLDGDSKGEIVNDDEEGRVLHSKEGGKGIMAPVAVAPEDPKRAQTLEFRVRLKPNLGSCYFDAKDAGGESLFYAYVTPDGRLELQGPSRTYIPKAKIENKWQDWFFVINLQKMTLSRVIIDGKSYVISNFAVGGKAKCECFWLKDTSQLGSYFRSCSAAFPKK